MKSEDIKRSVRTHRHDRSTGDSPSIGRVSRMPGTGMPKGTRRKRKRSEAGQDNRLRQGRRRDVLTWSFLLAGAVVLVLSLAIWLWLVPKLELRGEIGRRIPIVAEEMTRLVSEFPSPSEPEALALVTQALATRDPGKVAECFRPGAASPQEIVEFLQGLAEGDGVVDRMEWLSSMDANGLSIDGVLVIFKGKDKPRNRLAMLTPEATGKWQIDFDAFARRVTPSWSELLERRAEVAQVRVYAARDSYYNGPFQDDKRWLCYGLASPDTTQILLGYCKIGSPQAAALKRIFSREAKMTRATLEIRRVQDGEPRQFEITQVLAEDWVMGSAPFDEIFQ